MKHIESKTTWCCEELPTWRIRMSPYYADREEGEVIQLMAPKTMANYLEASPLCFLKNNELKFCPFCGEKIEIVGTSAPLTTGLREG